MPSISVSAFSV
jgi:hypothetical protein